MSLREITITPDLVEGQPAGSIHPVAFGAPDCFDIKWLEGTNAVYRLRLDREFARQLHAALGAYLDPTLPPHLDWTDPSEVLDRR